MMRAYALVLTLVTMLLLPIAPSWTQDGRFEIGGATIYGNMRYPVPNSIWGSWVGDTAGRGSRDPYAIPTERWEQLLDLGLTMAHFTIVPDRLVEGADNVARKLNHAAWVRGLSLSLSDPFLWDFTRTERRLSHPESMEDFDRRSGGEAVFSQRLHAGYHGNDRHNMQQTGNNAIRFAEGRDDGVEVTGWRRGGEVFTDRGGTKPSGFYVVSARCAVRPGDLLPGGDAVFEVMLTGSAGHVRLPCTPDMLAAAITRGDAAAGRRDTVVIEVILGRVWFSRVPASEGSGVRVSHRDGPGPDPGFNERTRADEPLELTLRFHGGADITIDAVILSDERAFAFFNSGHPDLKPGEVGLADTIRHRMRLLGADSTAPFPALRFLEFSESLASDGSDVPARALAAMLRDMAGRERVPVRAFVWASGAATKDPTAIARSVASMRGLVDGHYLYPFEEGFAVRPTDAAYYDSTYFPVPYERGGQHTWSNFQSLSDWFRQFAIARNRFGIREWMPALQTHSWQFRSGWPTVALADTGWLYEPAAAEFRFQCNLALCHGATSVMLYVIHSWPGRAMNANITARDDPAYGDMGAIGLLDPHNNQPRRLDTNGEDKFDSTRAFLRGSLRPHGEMLARMRWRYSDAAHRGMLRVQGGVLDTVMSWRDVGTNAVFDPPERCFVEIGEFLDADNSTWLFVVNKRVDPAGDRQIALSLRDQQQTLELFPVPGVTASLTRDGDGRAILSLPPGHAALLRVR